MYDESENRKKLEKEISKMLPCFGSGNCPEGRNLASCGWSELCLRKCVDNREIGLDTLGKRNEYLVDFLKYLKERLQNVDNIEKISEVLDEIDLAIRDEWRRR